MCKRLHPRASAQTKAEPSTRSWPSVCIYFHIYLSTLTFVHVKEGAVGQERTGTALPIILIFPAM